MYLVWPKIKFLLTESFVHLLELTFNLEFVFVHLPDAPYIVLETSILSINDCFDLMYSSLFQKYMWKKMWFKINFASWRGVNEIE